MIQFYGAMLILFGLLLFISILWFYFDPLQNISYVHGTSDTSPNIARSVGSYLSVGLVEYTFGIAAIGFPFLIFLYGFKVMFNKELLPLFKTTANVIISMAWFSILFGMIIKNPESNFIYGYFGSYISSGLLSLGKLVAAFIMLALFILIIVLFYNVQISEFCQNIGAKIDEKRAENGKEPKERKRGKDKDIIAEDDTDTVHQDLDDPYISDHHVFTNEYLGKNTYTFETSQAEKEKEQPVTAAEPSVKTIDMDDVPFEVVTAPVPEEKNFEPEGEEVAEEPVTSLEQLKDLEPYDPHKELSTYEFPSTDLLDEHETSETTQENIKKELLENKHRIENTLKSFGIPIKRITATVGPTVTLYEIVPEEGVRISKIKNLEDDIALSLAALGIRIIAPIPGRGTIGIEVPNKNANIVSMKEIIESDKFKNNKYSLPIGLGKTISNEAFVVDLAKMPHLLVAGATGQGKSVGLNAIITSLLYTKHPSEMKLVLIDPKKVEFTLYSAIQNYYLAELPDQDEPIVTDTQKVVRTLNSLCAEMDQRYDLLKAAKMRNIKEYNEKFCSRQLSPAMGHRYLPYIVLIIDEFGDLIMTAGREVETPLARLAQLARAIGIHLVIATQRPSVNIITGSIKANFPSRMAFRVASKIDSRTILDASGADQLIGKGDMLITTGSDLIRVQCAFVDTPEVERIVNHIEAKSELSPLLEPYVLPDVPDKGKEDFFEDPDDTTSDAIDPLFVDAATLIVQTQQGSTSFIQRRMKLGYNRAGRIMDQLCEFGVVGQANGSKPREVLIKTDMQLRELLESKGML
ncbi:MAG: DNA translocase FtsK 4TM domain-containing protein [Bacteroidales bacterium]|nr:DNA translocase FtsK 4TM domain-containing protein [Bacteroidales bacterium]